MSIFRFVENTPDTYVDQSRDFQLLCNLCDLVQNSTKHSIDSMLQILDTGAIPSALIGLLQTKLGFFVPDYSIYTATALRVILSAFQSIVRQKGSRLAIQSTLNLFMKVLNVDNVVTLLFESDDDKYTVKVQASADLTDTRILKDIFSYVLPSGYRVVYEQIASADRIRQYVQPTDRVNTVPTIENKRVYKADELSGMTRNELFNTGGTSTATLL